jgi:argininosuccinate lyase
MPQKRNPDVCELVRAKAGAMTGRLMGTFAILKGMPSGYNRDLQECKEPFLEGLDEALASIEIMTGVISLTTFDAIALRRAFTPGVFATDRALELVAKGVPFRDAYNTVKATMTEQGVGDPDAALAAKRHLGATAGLDFKYYGKRIAAERRWIKTEERRTQRAIGALLGLPYPSLSEQGDRNS